MLDLTQYESLGAALNAAMERWPDEICLIEADRERERCRFTYREFRDAAHGIAAGAARERLCRGDRAAILMTNQSKWLISAYAIFYCGGVLVPLDYKLSRRRNSWRLLAHSKAHVLIMEYPHLAGDQPSARFRPHEWQNGAGDRSSRRMRIWPARSDGRSSAARARRNFGPRERRDPPASSIPPAPADGPRAAC